MIRARTACNFPCSKRILCKPETQKRQKCGSNENRALQRDRTRSEHGVCLPDSLWETGTPPDLFLVISPLSPVGRVCVCWARCQEQRGVNWAQVTTNGPPELPDHLCSHRGSSNPAPSQNKLWPHKVE